MKNKTHTLLCDSLSKIFGHRTSVFLRPLCSLSSLCKFGYALTLSLTLYLRSLFISPLPLWFHVSGAILGLCSTAIFSITGKGFNQILGFLLFAGFRFLFCLWFGRFSGCLTLVCKLNFWVDAFGFWLPHFSQSVNIFFGLLYF